MNNKSRIMGVWKKSVSVIAYTKSISIQRYNKDQNEWNEIFFCLSLNDFEDLIEMINDASDKIELKTEPNPIKGVWNKNVSVVQRSKAITIERFNKLKNKWEEVIFFLTLKDLDNFVDVLDNSFERLEEEGWSPKEHETVN